MIDDALLLVGSELLFFSFGWVFLVKKLFIDYEALVDRKNVQLVQAVFSVTFSFSCALFELLIFEIVGLMDKQ
jgi:hypothetical protein